MIDLSGQRVIVTRSAEDCAEWSTELERLGARVVVYPCITTESIDTPALRARLAESAARADWVIFTSARGVAAFAALNAAPLTPHCRIAVVGAATAEAARRAFGRVAHVGGGTALTLAESLIARPDFGGNTHVLLALAENAAATLEEKLAAAGATCDRLSVYRTVSIAERGPKQPLSAFAADKILFASPSAVTGFLNRVSMDGAIDVFTIGPSTSAAARSLGLKVTAEARVPSLEGLLEAMHG